MQLVLFIVFFPLGLALEELAVLGRLLLGDDAVIDFGGESTGAVLFEIPIDFGKIIICIFIVFFLGAGFLGLAV